VGIWVFHSDVFVWNLRLSYRLRRGLSWVWGLRLGWAHCPTSPNSLSAPFGMIDDQRPERRGAARWANGLVGGLVLEPEALGKSGDDLSSRAPTLLSAKYLSHLLQKSLGHKWLLQEVNAVV